MSSTIGALLLIGLIILAHFIAWSHSRYNRSLYALWVVLAACLWVLLIWLKATGRGGLEHRTFGEFLLALGASTLIATAPTVLLRMSRDEEVRLARCDWCGSPFPLTGLEFDAMQESGRAIYCSGRCRRADEASRGVKEKRIRFIDHE